MDSNYIPKWSAVNRDLVVLCRDGMGIGSQIAGELHISSQEQPAGNIPQISEHEGDVVLYKLGL